MSMPTLSEIVSSALKQVSEDVPGVKLASSSDVPDPTFDLLDPLPSASKSEEKVAAATTTEVLDDGAYALKLASCLEVAGGLLRKQSAEGNAVAVLEATNNAPVTLSPAPKGPVEKAVTTSAPVVAGPMPDSEGDHTGDPDWTSNKEAAEEMVTHKIAQAQLLEELGKHEEAAGLIEEAEKVAKGWMDVKDEKSQGRVGATLLGIEGGLLSAMSGAGVAGVLREKAEQKAIAKNPLIRLDKLPKSGFLTAAIIAGSAAVGGGLSGYGGMRLGRASARAAQARERELAELVVATQNKTSARMGAAVGGGLGGPVLLGPAGAAIGADKGKAQGAVVGSTLGGIGGGVLGAVGSSIYNRNKLLKAVINAKTEKEVIDVTSRVIPAAKGVLAATAIGIMAGSALGAYAGHGKSDGQNKSAHYLTESEKLAVSNKWIADKIYRGAKGVTPLLSGRNPIAKAQTRAVLSATQALGGKKARNEAVRGVVEQTRNLKGKGLVGSVKYLSNPSKKQVVHTARIGQFVQRRVGAVRDAIRKTAAEAGSLNTEEAVPSIIPDNAGMIALTAAKARKKTQEEAAKFLTQPVQSDPVIEAEVQNTEGAKVSSLLNAVQIRGLV